MLKSKLESLVQLMAPADQIPIIPDTYFASVDL